jgi:hypothetical protein
MDFGQAAFDGANGGFDFLSWYAYVFQFRGLLFFSLNLTRSFLFDHVLHIENDQSDEF